MWQRMLLPCLPFPLLLLFFAYKQWDKYQELNNRVSRLRSLGAL
jgi:hypothetical protein